MMSCRLMSCRELVNPSTQWSRPSKDRYVRYIRYGLWTNKGKRMDYGLLFCNAFGICKRYFPCHTCSCNGAENSVFVVITPKKSLLQIFLSFFLLSMFVMCVGKQKCCWQLLKYVIFCFSYIFCQPVSFMLPV